MVAPDSRVVWDVTNHILVPNEWVVVVGLEFLRDKVCPSIKCMEPPLAEHGQKMALNGKYCCSSNAVANNTDRRDRLVKSIRFPTLDIFVPTYWVENCIVGLQAGGVCWVDTIVEMLK